MNGTITVINSYPCVCVYWRGESMFDNACAEANIDSQDVDAWYISRVFVKEHLRGKSIGSQVLQTLLSEIKKQNTKKVIVSPGGYDNDKDRQFNFYLKNGFKHSIENDEILVYTYETA